VDRFGHELDGAMLAYVEDSPPINRTAELQLRRTGPIGQHVRKLEEA
jgi:hypothetical protein